MMQQVIRQLERVRDLGRLLLVSQRLLQWISGVLAVALACGVLDFVLRLPGWLRLALGLIIAAVAIDWLILRLVRALRFRPDLGVLALRAERMYPQLAGRLASAVEFATHEQEYRQPTTTAALAGSSIAAVQGQLVHVSLGRLLDPTQTLRVAALAAVVTLATAAVVVTAPAQSLLAVQRWLLPLGSAQWPHRFEVQSLVTERVWPADTPLRLRAQVTRGYRQGLRTLAYHRVLGPDGRAGAWQESLMNVQAESAAVGGYEALADVASALASAGVDPAVTPGSVELYFKTGDHQTDIQRVQLVQRPALRGLNVSIEPPPYARGLVSDQQVALDQQTGSIATAAALQGSRIQWRLLLNKPIPAEQAALAAVLPGLADARDLALDAARLNEAQAPQLLVSFRLDQTVQTPVRLVDEHGLSNDSERLYRLEAVTDKAPAVAMVQPRGDEAVLASAVVEVEAVAQDDVALESLQLQALASTGSLPSAGPGPATPPAGSGVRVLTLREVTGRSSRMIGDHTLDLAPLSLKPGDEVELTAITRDVYEMDGLRHDPVRATPRRLRVIDSATLVGQVRTELAGLRQQLIRLEDQQRQLLKAEPAAAQRPQQQLSERLGTQQALIDAIRQRLQRNKLAEPQLDQVLQRADELLQEAEKSSQEAVRKLGEAQKPQQFPESQAAARRAQERADAAMGKLVELLDQGRDALTLQLQLKQLATMQESVAQDTRQMLPRTMGKSPEQLSEAERRQLQELADRQAALAESSRALAQQMQTAADAMARQSKDAQNQAAAQALAEAAAIAQRQGLSESMQQAAQQASQNQLSSAGQQQAAAQQTLQQMLQQMGQQDQLRQEMLRRKLLQLAEALTKLIERQTAELGQARQAGDLPALEPAQGTLRRNTMAVAEQAREARDSEPAAARIDQAAAGQGQAMQALRQAQREPALKGQEEALTHLQEALRQVQEMQRQAREEQQRQQRQELRERYEKLARQQDELKQRTEAAAPAGELTRRQRATLVELGDQQADLRGEARDLEQLVGETLVFQHLHQRVDRAAEQVVTQLRAAKAGKPVVAEQTTIASLLRRMAEALAQANEQSEFAQSQGSPEGGEGGGGGGEAPLVPPIAELRLLRGMQDAVYQQTRQYAGQPGLEDSVLQLSVQQRELAALGEQMIEQMQRQQQMMMPPGHPSQPEGEPAPQPEPQPQPRSPR